MLTDEKTTLLDQPLDMTRIKHRRGAGNRQLAYISGKFAMDQANRIFGYGCWGYKVVARGHMVIDDPKRGKIDMYTADVELSVVGAAYTFPGAGVGLVTEPFTAESHEKAYKEAETDAMKRALRHYGDQMGLVLYDSDDYVDAGNGEMIQVKDVPVQGRPQPPRRVVGANSVPVQIPAPGLAPQQPAAQQGKPAYSLRKHFEAVYKRALTLKQFSFSNDATDEVRLQAFLDFAGPLVDATLTSAGHLTRSRLDTIEAYLNAKDAA